MEIDHRFEEILEPQYVDPQVEHCAAARKLDLSIEAINRARDPHLYTQKRHLTESLAYRLANPDVSLEEITRNSGLPLNLLQEDLLLAQEAFQWAADVISGGNKSKEHPESQSNPELLLHS